MPTALLTTVPLTAGTWRIDPDHSSVSFRIRHLGLAHVRGRFNRFAATLRVGRNLATTTLEAAVDMSSVDTNQPDRDAHLRSTDFFDAETHPEMLFRSTAIEASGDGRYAARGDLTINGITRPVELDVAFSGVEVSPMDGVERAGFLATCEIVREDFGIDFNLPLGVDKVALAKRVAVEIEAELAPTT